MSIRPSPSAGPSADLRKPEAFGSKEALSDIDISVQPRVESPPAELPRDARPSGVPSGGSSRDQSHAEGSELGLPHDVSLALRYGLEMVKYGAMLVAVEGHPHVANRAALAILERNDGLSLTNTGLVADRASDTRLLLKLLQDAIKMPERGEPKDSPFTLPRKTARTALIVRIVPGPGLSCWCSTENRAAMLMLYDQDPGLEVNISMLSKLYGLTRGEAALAASLIRGKSIEEASEELFISPHTARTHLKRIFMKTDTHRQTELVVRTFPAVL